MKQLKLKEAFELLDSDGNYLELGNLILKEHRVIGTGEIDYYNLKIELIGHDNKFTLDELKSRSVQKPKGCGIEIYQGKTLPNEICGLGMLCPKCSPNLKSKEVSL